MYGALNNIKKLAFVGATSENIVHLGDDKEDGKGIQLEESQVVVSKSVGKKPIDGFIVESESDNLPETDFIQDLLVGKEDQGEPRCTDYLIYVSQYIYFVN